jgi:hypothetical protein
LQDGKFAVSPDDALTNVPYVPGCGLWFDHHATEVKRVVEAGVPFHGACYVVPSAARVVYDFYGGTWTVGNVIVSDLRSVDTIYAGNQFLVYASWPGQNISIWIVNGKAGQNCVFASLHSILNRSSRVHVGDLMRRFGDGGHEAAGTCQVPHEDADDTLRAIVAGLQDEARVLAKAA